MRVLPRAKARRGLCMSSQPVWLQYRLEIPTSATESLRPLITVVLESGSTRIQALAAACRYHRWRHARGGRAHNLARSPWPRRHRHPVRRVACTPEGNPTGDCHTRPPSTLRGSGNPIPGVAGSIRAPAPRPALVGARRRAARCIRRYPDISEERAVPAAPRALLTEGRCSLEKSLLERGSRRRGRNLTPRAPHVRPGRLQEGHGSRLA